MSASVWGEEGEPRSLAPQRHQHHHAQQPAEEASSIKEAKKKSPIKKKNKLGEALTRCGRNKGWKPGRGVPVRARETRQREQEEEKSGATEPAPSWLIDELNKEDQFLIKRYQ